jgi:hypothetical protein
MSLSEAAADARKLVGDLFTVLVFGITGALAAGIYGALHDQVTYSISPEYFTNFKFQLFAYANPGLPARCFVAVIGFLATWRLGAFAGCVLTVIALARWGRPIRKRPLFTSFGIIIGAAFLAGIIGGALGYSRRSDPNFQNWHAYADTYGVHDLPAFVNVGYIHNAGYLGGEIGFLLAIILMLIAYNREAPATHSKK